jgi:hypothetical protein
MKAQNSVTGRKAAGPAHTKARNKPARSHGQNDRSTSLTHAGLPKHPTFYVEGEAQSEEFTEGVLWLHQILLDLPGPEQLTPGPVNALAYGKLFVDVFSGGADQTRGACMALADYFAASRYSEVAAEEWQPLETPLVCRTHDGDCLYDPAPRSRFFLVDGRPVSVGTELYCYAWKNGIEPEEFELDAVRKSGIEIDRDMFEATRAALSNAKTRVKEAA